MLVVCNGAIKSGSTWLYNILAELLDFSKPPERYLTNGNQINATIRPELLKAFLESEDFHNQNYLTKNHLGKLEHKVLLFSFRDVVVIDILRDVRDVAVSSYYDAINRDDFRGSFEKFYWGEGRELAHAVTKYHELWKPKDRKVLRVCYEKLKDDFANEAQKVATFLGIELSSARVDAVREHTSMDSLRRQYQGEQLYQDNKFFRKGIVGDWQNHFSTSMIRDIERIERRGLRRFDPRVVLRRLRVRLGTMGWSSKGM